MENASKALLMAAGVLIALMIISLGVYLFINFGGTSSTIHANITQNQINQFNSQFTVYDGTEVTIYEVVSMANLAKQNNEQYGLTSSSGDEDYYISVTLKKNLFTTSKLDKYTDEQINNLISIDVNNITSTKELNKYLVEVSISTITGRVKSVVCTRQN